MDFFHYLANLFTGNTSGNGTGAETAGIHIPTGTPQSPSVPSSPTQITGNIGNPSTGTPPSFTSTPNTPPSTTLASGNLDPSSINFNLPGLPSINFPDIGAGLGKIGDFLLPYMDALSGKAGVEEARREYDENMTFARDEQSYQRGIDAQNQANIDREFEYQQYLNENQTQISARDAALAGINPLAMKGNNVSSTGGAVSSGSSAPQSNGALTQALSVQGSQLLSLGQQLVGTAQTAKQRKSAEKIAYDGLENTLAIAKMSDATTLLNLYNQAIDSGIDPSLILKKLGINDDGINKVLQLANRSSHHAAGQVAGLELVEQLEKGTFKGRAQDLAENEFKLKDPTALIKALGISDKSSDVIKSVLAILSMLR